MNSKKKWIWEIVFLLVVFGGTMYGVFYGEDLGQILQAIRKAEWGYLVPAVFCVLFFVWGESIIIYYLMGTLSIRLKKWTCFLFSSIGFFFSCITPSASGGQPAQIYYMRRKAIPVPVSTLVLMVVTITYKAVLVLMGLGILLFGQGFLAQYPEDVLPLLYLGIFLNVCCVGIMIVLVFHVTLAKELLSRGLGLLERLHIVRYQADRHEKLESGMDKYRETAVYFKTHKHVILHVLLITFAQRLALFLSTYFVYLAFGLHGAGVGKIMLLQSTISIAVDMLPLPGGMGISESMFLKIFLPLFGESLILPGMILSRGISYYTQLLVCAILTVFAHFTIGKREGNKGIPLSKNVL